MAGNCSPVAFLSSFSLLLCQQKLSEILFLFDQIIKKYMFTAANLDIVWATLCCAAAFSLLLLLENSFKLSLQLNILL